MHDTAKPLLSLLKEPFVFLTQSYIYYDERIVQSIITLPQF